MLCPPGLLHSQSFRRRALLHPLHSSSSLCPSRRVRCRVSPSPLQRLQPSPWQRFHKFCMLCEVGCLGLTICLTAKLLWSMSPCLPSTPAFRDWIAGPCSILSTVHGPGIPLPLEIPTMQGLGSRIRSHHPLPPSSFPLHIIVLLLHTYSTCMLRPRLICLRPWATTKPFIVYPRPLSSLPWSISQPVLAS